MTFDIREHLEKLTPAGKKDRYICPVCSGNNLTIDPKDGAYQCWSGCECKDIRDAIAPLTPQPKAVRPKSDRTWTYTDLEGNPSIRTRRIDDGQGKRKIWQEYLVDSQWLSGGKVADELKTPLKHAIAPYRYRECQDAIACGEKLLWVEGEPCADALWSLGIAATTSIGGSASYDKYGNYSDCFTKLVIVPDRDEAGIKYSEAIALDCPDAQRLYPFPESLLWDRLPKDHGLDIADWVDELRSEGLSDEQIRDRIVGAIEPKRSPQQQQTTNATDEFEGGKPHFWSTPERGLVWETFEKDPETGETKRVTQRVGNHLEAIGYVDTPESDGAALLLEFKTIRGQIRRWTMPRTGLAGNPAALLDELYRRSYTFKRKQKSLLLDYLCELGGNVEQTYTVTDKTDWLNGSFVLPNKTYGDESLRFRDIEPSPDCPFEIKGTLDGWRSEVAAKCEGNSRLIFALGTSFAAPLLPLASIESGGFHLVGGTSQGKTTALSVAASVIGVKEIPHWRTTSNGLESTATAYNHLGLPIDEIGQAEPKDVGAIAYMLANGQGKSRMKRDLSRSPVKTWQLLFLSSGEVGLRDYLKQAGISIKGGQEVRLPDLPAIPQNSQYGVFEKIHGCESPVEFVNALERAVKQQHGTALDAYLTQLVEDNKVDGFAKQLTNRLFAIATELSANYADAAISRVAKRFALVQVALHLAHSYGLLPFPIEQCDWAVKTMFTDWVNARGGDGSIEIKQALERIEHLFVSNQHGDRVYNLDSNNTQIVRNLLAYRKLDPFEKELEYWIPNAVFNSEVAKDCDRASLIAELQRVGWLRPPGADGKPYLGRRIDGKFTRVYVFTRFWNSEKSEVSEVSEVSARQDRDTVKHPDSEEVIPDPGITRYQRYQQEVSDSPLIPVIPVEKTPGISEASSESPDSKGVDDSDTCDTCDTREKHDVGKPVVGCSVKIADKSAIADYAPTMPLDLYEAVFQIAGIGVTGDATISYLGQRSYLLPLDCLEIVGVNHE